MKKSTLLTLLLISVNIVYSQVESDFEKFKKEQEKEKMNMMQNDSVLYASLEKEYQNYIKAEKEAYDSFVKKMSGIWGNDNVIESTSKEWVEYSDNGNSRSKVDFETGEAISSAGRMP